MQAAVDTDGFDLVVGSAGDCRQGFDAAARPLILKRLGELYEATGNAEKAALRYREFLALWDKPDPQLQPKVDDVRYRLSRLANIER